MLPTPPSHPPASSATPTLPPAPVLRGAIAGCGFFGQIHLEAWRRMPGVEIVAACDADLAKAQASAPRAYRNLEELLDAERPDFLDIATRPEWHLPMLRAAVARGIPCISQKPLAPTWADCLEFCRLAESSGLLIGVHENWRWQPWYRQARLAISAGLIGSPISYTFRIRRHDGHGPSPYPAQPYFQNYPRLLLYETLIHPIDTARFLFGPVEAVFARASRVNPVIAGEDLALVTLTHANGLHGLVDGNRYLDLAPNSPPLGDAVFAGELGQLEVTGEGHLLLRNAHGLHRLWTNQITAGYRGDSVYATNWHYLQALRGLVSLENRPQEYLLSVATMEAAYRSLQTNRLETVSLPSPDWRRG